MKRLVLVGGGHSHVEVLRQFGLRPASEIEITLVSPARDAPYSGMLPGLIAGHYGYHDCHIDLERLARFAGARFTHAQARGLDRQRQQVLLADAAAIDYDVVSFDVGSMPAALNVPGAPQYAIAVRPVETFLAAWAVLIERARAGSLKRLAVVGGGAAGVELLLAMQYRLAQLHEPDAVRFVLATDTDRLLTGHNPRVQSAFQRILSGRKIEVRMRSRIARIEPGAVVVTNGQPMAAEAVVWATGAAAPSWLRETGLALDAAGFIAINPQLQSIADSKVFAAGDCATIQGRSYPKSGVYAVSQGPPLAENLRRAVTGKSLLGYRPQARALALISAGDKYAIASYGGLALKGAWVWRWKDRIDRSFMAKYDVPGICRT